MREDCMKIIFIAGADHSGSTLAGAILGADKKPYRHFHIGEAHAFFCKGNKRFGNPKAARKMTGGEIWDEIDPMVGYENAYEEIFNKTKAEMIIDSSKTPRNLSIFKTACVEKQYSIHVVVTFRPFAKIWNSDLKRNKNEKKIIQNINRYFRYKKMVMDQGLEYSIINMENLILDPPGITSALCSATGVPYFKGKENYWQFPGCHLYGSHTQRRHFSKPQTAGFDARKVLKMPSISASFLQEKSVRSIEEFLMSNSLTAL
jgi:hypothetical protein